MKKTNKIKKILILVLMCALLLTLLVGCSSKKEGVKTKTFKDSLGREVNVPVTPKKIAVTGPLAQIIVFAIAPDKLVGTATKWEEKAKGYIDEKFLALPNIGQLYGGKGDLNLETLMMSGADLIIDVGEPTKNLEKELDDIQNQTQIPCVHVNFDIKTADETYTMLGRLLDMKDEASKIATYCKEVYERTKEIAENVSRERLLYIVGEEGLNVIAKDSFYSEIIDMLSDNVAKVDNPTSKGTGNEVDMEQIIIWNPDVIIVSPNTIYDEMAEDEVWRQVSAVKNGKYYEVPEGPYNWMGFPPSIQRLLGMNWLAKVLYPKEATYDLYEEVAKFYDLFYHHELSIKEYDDLLKKSGI